MTYVQIFATLTLALALLAAFLAGRFAFRRSQVRRTANGCMSAFFTMVLVMCVGGGLISFLSESPLRNQSPAVRYEQEEATHWRRLDDGEIDALVHEEQGITFGLVCIPNDNGYVAEFVRSPGVAFSAPPTERGGTGSASGKLDSTGWLCSPDMSLCHTEDVRGGSERRGLIALDIIAGNEVTYEFPMSNGSTRRVTYQFSEVRNQFAELWQRCTGTPLPSAG